jgi:replicative DNA helicase
MIDLDRDSKPIDLLTLFDYLKANGNLMEEVGESSYLTYLTEIVPATENVGYYAKLVKEKSIMRKLVMAASDIAHRGNDDNVDIDEFLDQAEHTILDIAQNKIKPSFYDSRELAAKALEIIEALHARKELVTGIATGYAQDALQ